VLSSSNLDSVNVPGCSGKCKMKWVV
jgi:hypothetical protein